MADRRAMASGFSLSEMGSEVGCCMKVAVGGGTMRGGASVRATGASWAAVTVGVMGDTGGRFGDADSERFPERSEVVEASLDEAGRGVVSTRRAGMAALWEVVSTSQRRGLAASPTTAARLEGLIMQRSGSCCA